MLTRAARRRQALRSVELAAEKLQLPWLCPVLNTSSSSNVQKRSTSTRPSISRSQTFVTQRPPARRLASAASIADDFDRDEYLPFSYERSRSAPPNRNESLSHYDLSNILMMDYTVAQEVQSESNRHNDLRAHANDIEATLEACLQVQRWDRAFKILNQLTRLFAGNTSKLQHLYNRFLEAMVFDFIWNQNTHNKERINKWIEVHMRKAGIQPTAQTFALKIKIALATMEGSRQHRTVTRYWDMAKEHQFENQVASLRDILSDRDLGKLSEICPLKIDFDLEPELNEHDDEQLPTSDHVMLAPGTPSAVRETDQKGLGLVSLRQSLAQFRDPDRQAADPKEEEALARAYQIRLEQDSVQSAMERWRIENEKRMKTGASGTVQSGKVGALAWQWHEAMAQKIRDELQLVEDAESSSKVTHEERLRCEYGPFLRLVNPNKLAALAIISSVQHMSRMGVASTMRLSKMVSEVGRSVEFEYMALQKKAKNNVKKAKGSKVESPGTTPSSKLENFEFHHSTFGSTPRWSASVYAKVGAVLCEIMFDTAKISVTNTDPESGQSVTLAEPVFRSQAVYMHGRKVSTVSMHAAFSELLTREPPAQMIAKLLPMISKPKPWSGYNDGGYLKNALPVLRVKFGDVAQRDYAKAAAERGDLDQVFAGLDVLGSTGWLINKNVYNVMLQAWNSGEKVANLPPLDKAFPPVEKPGENAPAMETWRYYTKLREQANEKSGLHSNRCFQNFQMEIAQSYLDQTFYLPHNVDFRGRAYPIPPYLNQMGADNARGLLLFAQGRELGTEGLKWLQVHLANVFGYDKASLSDRAQFALDHIEDIRDSVNNPLNGKRWWLEAEDPWQCLATSHELVNALDSPDPTKFVSHLPIHQDGTCNGLQHYAALGGDLAGARQVNLEPGDKPADVYTGVAELVKSEIKQDAADGLEIAKLLEGRITRKIVKQTVMTNVYGVTFTGAIRQVKKQIDDLLPDLNSDGHGAQAAVYIAKKIFKGLGKLFEGAHEIQYWLGDCANRITNSVSPAQLRRIEKMVFKGTPSSFLDEINKQNRKDKAGTTIDRPDFRSTVIWTTPLGLPVVQPYRMSFAEVVKTSFSGIRLMQPHVADAVDPRKQLQAFPPNFIHSLDATHMMLSALKAHELNLSFSAVHDSFWTHAADIPKLNSLLREAFIRMHSEDIIGRLAAEFRARYKGHLYMAKIGRHNKVAKQIQKYRYGLPDYGAGVKKQRYNELVREIKRARLLASEDPKERAEGEQMITAATIFEQLGGDKYLPDKVSLGQTAVGEMPDADPLAVQDALDAEGMFSDVGIADVLEPLVDSDAETSVEGETASLQEEALSESKSKSKSKKKKSEPSGAKDHIWLWLPLTFKSVPKKGEFNVERLRNSTYFFS